MKTMDNVKRRIITSMIAILLLVITLFGIAYAYFVANVKGNDKNKSVSVTSGILKLTYEDGNGILTLGDYLKPGQTVKFKDKDGNIVTEKTFSVKNTGAFIINDYEVVLENVENDLVNYQDLVYTLTCRSDKEGKDCNDSNGIFPKTNQVLVINEIDVDETQYFTLTMKFNETNKDQSIDMNKNISAKINIQDNESALKNLIVYGNSVQEGIPSESIPVEIQSVGDKSKNLFDKTNIIENGYIDNSDGIFKPDTNYHSSNFIEVPSGEKIYITKMENVNGGAFYNENKEYVSGFNGDEVINVPETAKYIRITILPAYLDILQIEVNSAETEYEPYGYKIPIKVTGKNILPKSTDNKILSGVTFNVNDDGSILVNGTATEDIYYMVNQVVLESGKDYKLSVGVNNMSWQNYIVYSEHQNSVNEILSTSFDFGAGVTMNITDLDEYAYSRVYIYIKKDIVLDNILFKPLVEGGTLKTEYEPYKETTYNIYVNEPLRKVGETADYIDFLNYQVVRNVEVLDDSGTKTIEESYKKLIVPKYENIKLPILIKEIVGDIEIGTTVEPSKIEY